MRLAVRLSSELQSTADSWFVLGGSILRAPDVQLPAFSATTVIDPHVRCAVLHTGDIDFAVERVNLLENGQSFSLGCVNVDMNAGVPVLAFANRVDQQLFQSGIHRCIRCIAGCTFGVCR